MWLFRDLSGCRGGSVFRLEVFGDVRNCEASLKGCSRVDRIMLWRRVFAQLVSCARSRCYEAVGCSGQSSNEVFLGLVVRIPACQTDSACSQVAGVRFPEGELLFSFLPSLFLLLFTFG